MSRLPTADGPTLSSALSDAIEQEGGVGATAAVFSRTGVIWQGAAGTTRPDGTDPPDPNEAFPIFSITKTLVASAAICLRDGGAIDLDETVDRWFPTLPNAGVTSVRQLLNHTSGIPDYGQLEEYHDAVRSSPSTPWPLERLLDLVMERGVWRRPPATWAYSNINYWLAGRVLENADGRPLSEILRRHVFEPAGLLRACYPDGGLPRLPPGYSTYLTDAAEDVSDRYHTGWAGPAGAILAPVGDVARFFAALFGDDLMAASSREEMCTLVHVPPAPDQPDYYYGLGVACDRQSPIGTAYGHGGGGPGYTSMAIYAPGDDVGGVVLSNHDDVSPERLLFPLLRAARRQPRA